MGIISGLVDIAGGLYSMAKGVVNVVWGMFKLALLAAILPIIGIYYMVKGIFDYAKRKYREIKNKRPNVKPTGAGSITGKALAQALKNTKPTILETISLSDLEKEEAIQDINTIEKKMDSGEMDGMQYMEVKNEKGEDEVIDAEFFKASTIDTDSKDKHVFRPIE